MNSFIFFQPEVYSLLEMVIGGGLDVGNCAQRNSLKNSIVYGDVDGGG